MWTPEEESRQRDLLWAARHLRDRDAADEVVQQCEGLITKVVREHFSSRGLARYKELFHVGRIGVFKAVMTFDPSRSSFIRHAAYKAEWAIRHYLRSERQSSRRDALSVQAMSEQLADRWMMSNKDTLSDGAARKMSVHFKPVEDQTSDILERVEFVWIRRDRPLIRPVFERLKDRERFTLDDVIQAMAEAGTYRTLANVVSVWRRYGLVKAVLR